LNPHYSVKPASKKILQAQRDSRDAGYLTLPASIFQKKSKKGGMFFNPEKHHTKHHDLPRIHHTSPRFTITKHPKIRKTPCKNHLDTPPNFFPRHKRKVVETCSYP
jgi:hypothetical protein